MDFVGVVGDDGFVFEVVVGVGVEKMDEVFGCFGVGYYCFVEVVDLSF